MALPAARLARPALPVRVPGAVALAGAMALVAAVVAAAVDRPGTPPEAPAFSLEEVRRTGGTVTLPPVGRPAVVNFFASWCVPCRDELPVLEQAHRRYGAEVAFVGVDVADSRTAATDLLARTGVTFPAGYDPQREVAERYRLRGMPTTVFVDAAGRMVDVAHGKLTADELDRRLSGLTDGVRVGGK